MGGLAVIIGLIVLAVIALFVLSSSDEQAEPDAAPDEQAEPDAAPDEQARPTVTVDPSDLLPVGDTAGSRFVVGSAETTLWEGSIVGLIETDVADDRPGRCVTLVGTMTPTETSGVVSGTVTAPDFELAADEASTEGFLRCDGSRFESAGYGLRFFAHVTRGTPYPFFVPFHLPDADPDVPLDISAVLVDDLSSETVFAYEPTFVDDLPAASTDGVPADTEGRPMGDIEAAFEYRWIDTWDVVPLGLVEAGTQNGERCLVLLGTITPSDVTDGDVAAPDQDPGFGLLQNGRTGRGTRAGCETEVIDAIEAAGYGRLSGIDGITEGTTFAFFVELEALATPDTPIELLLVGDFAGSDVAAYEPTFLSEIPPAER